MSLQRDILRTLRERQHLPREERGVTVSQLAQETGVHDYIVAATIAALCGEGLVQAMRQPGSVRYFISQMGIAVGASAQAAREDTQ